jgi:predicted enzyme related to lactoylglutathione lyase
MHPNPIAWFELYVQDMPRAKAFYEAVFQGELTAMSNPNADDFDGMEMWAFPAEEGRYGAPGALVKMPGCPSGGSTLVYFACEDCAVEANRAAAHGGSIFKAKTPIGPYGHIALVMDTEGNMVGLHSMD